MVSPRQLFPELLAQEPTPFRAVYRQVEYPGEVLASETWQPQWGEIRERDVHFRLVFLTRHQTVPPPADRRVALLLPPTVVRDAASLYGAGTRGVRLFREGRVVATPALNLSPRAALEGSNEEAFGRLARALLGRAYSSSPLASATFPRPLGGREVGLVFGGLFSSTPTAEARRALEDFAVGLGLAQANAPHAFDPRECPVFSLIRAHLERTGGSLAFEELYQELSRTYGLTCSLVVLYVLAFVRASPLPVQLKLRREHRLALGSGALSSEDFLLPALVPEVRWRPGLDLALERLEYPQRPAWNLVLLYARSLVPDLGPATRDAAVAEGMARLRGRLEELQGALSRTRQALEPLAESPLLRQELGRLERLGRLLGTREMDSFSGIASREYPTPEALKEDLALLARLQAVAEHAAEIAAARGYLEEMALRDTDLELAMDRAAILEQVRLENLLSQPHLWPSVQAIFGRFQSRFRQVYVAYHEAYHREVASLRRRLLAAHGKLQALERLNSLEDLGDPVGQELSGDYRALVARLVPCPSPDLGETRSACLSCRVSLAQQPPAAEVDGFLLSLEAALEEQERRLSAEAIQEILRGSQDSRLEQFLKVVQASNTSPLVGVLDDSLVAFLRQLLQGIHTYPSLALRELAQKYPSLEESQVEEAVTELRQLLRQAFQKAHKARPGKRIRISFE